MLLSIKTLFECVVIYICPLLVKIYYLSRDVASVIGITPQQIKDIYYFEVNTKNISSRVLQIQMFSTHEMKYIWYLPNKSKFSFYFILFIGYT